MIPKDSDRAWVRQLGLFGWIVSELVASVCLGAGLGYLLRRYLGLGGWVLVIGTLLGFGLAMFRIYRVTRKELK